MTVSYYLTRPEAENETSIYARICYGRKDQRLKWYTPEKISPKYWNKETQKVRKTYSKDIELNDGEKRLDTATVFNDRLKFLSDSIIAIFKDWQNKNLGKVPAPETLRELLDLELKNKSEKATTCRLLDFFELIIEQSRKGIRLNPKNGKPIAQNTIKTYTTVLNHLTTYEAKRKKKIEFNDISQAFYDDYTTYLTQTLKMAVNTIGGHIKEIKLMMNEAYEKGLHNNNAHRGKRFVMVREKSDGIYLNESELKAIASLDLTGLKLDRVRDLFLIGCYTGLRFSDWSFQPDRIQGDFIEVTQTKTGNPVVIPIHDKVKQILEKYDGRLPKSLTNQKTNEYLKDLGKKVKSLDTPFIKSRTKGGQKVSGKEDGTDFKKWELLTTHTARRSFATNEYLAGTPTVTIMAITGHKTESSFLKYIKLSPTEHAKLLQLHWNKRKEAELLKVV